MSDNDRRFLGKYSDKMISYKGEESTNEINATLYLANEVAELVRIIKLKMVIDSAYTDGNEKKRAFEEAMRKP